MSQSLIYVTAGSREEAVGIGRILVESRLAACANVLAPMTSIYWWEGAVNEGDEVPLILKTRDGLVEKVIEKRVFCVFCVFSRKYELHSFRKRVSQSVRNHPDAFILGVSKRSSHQFTVF